jgi:hypothetical protein
MNSGNPPFDALLPQDDLLPDCHFCSLLLRLSNPPRPVLRVEVRVEVAFFVLLPDDLELRRLFLFFRQARRTLVLPLARRGTATGKAGMRRTAGRTTRTTTGRRRRRVGDARAVFRLFGNDSAVLDGPDGVEAIMHESLVDGKERVGAGIGEAKREATYRPIG